jgi:hypothetical protein
MARFRGQRVFSLPGRPGPTVVGSIVDGVFKPGDRVCLLGSAVPEHLHVYGVECLCHGPLPDEFALVLTGSEGAVARVGAAVESGACVLETV